MKKFLTLFVLTLSILSLFSCVKNPYACEEIYGIVKYSDAAERLTVYTPEYGDVEIPESNSVYASFNGSESSSGDDLYTLKEGDLVKISFVYEKAHDDSGVCVMESYPARFDRKADTIEALRENVNLEKGDNGYILSLYQDDAESFKIGDTVVLTQHFDNDGKDTIYVFENAKIININGNTLTAEIGYLDYQHDFLSKLASARFEKESSN